MEINENNNYLKFLINEDIYLIPENNDSKSNSEIAAINDIPASKKTISKKTIVIIEYPDSRKLPETVNSLLSKILRAVGLKIEDVHIFDTGKSGRSYEKLADQNLEDCKILAFLERFPTRYTSIFSDTKYSIKKTGGNFAILLDPLEVIEKDKSKKYLLWEKLKELYQIT